jgi:hypothetical protein
MGESQRTQEGVVVFGSKIERYVAPEPGDYELLDPAGLRLRTLGTTGGVRTDQANSCLRRSIRPEKNTEGLLRPLHYCRANMSL